MPVSRRKFVETAGAVLAIAKLIFGRELACDLAVIGGGVGGCAAALSAARNGMRVLLTEETGWIGGQLTSQAVPPDEHPWIESFGATRAYREYRHRVRDYYRRNYPLTEAARSRWDLNPGNGGVSKLTHEPRVSLAVLEAMLAPYTSSGRVTVLLRHKPIAAEIAGDSVRAVTVRDLETGRDRTISAPYFLDATEQGDLLPLARVEYVTGSESARETGEPHAPAEERPANMQAFTFCFAMDHLPGEDHTIDRPAEYSFWRDYVPALKPSWPGKLLSWTTTHPVTLAPRTHAFDPEYESHGADPGLWVYRHIADRRNFIGGAYASDISLVNWPQNDYWLGNICEVSEAEAARHIARARQLSLSLLYWMQTEAPRADGSRGWRGLRLRPDVTGAADGLAQYPYIRESRRIRAEFTVLEQHVGTDARKKLTGKTDGELTAAHFDDSVGVGSYRIDLHPSSGGDNYIDISSLPFEIPLGALIPRRVENLLPAAKNLGVTHITNGCYRLHPVEWNIGESAGLLAARSVQLKIQPRHIRNNEKLLREFQRWIGQQGVEIAWPKLTPR
ncbi:MAG TPA: FAD-dependent oxidoreductase [Bryobacteraceae bacterium]|nr:FAD-dependent oxidoreductase [Bryobacteraceae bacterium]